jgi:hypothetical protein
MFGVVEADRPFTGKEASRRGCLVGRKVVGRLEECLEFALSLLIRKKEEVDSECFRKSRTDTQGIP